jgi:hypothetical protein
MFVRSTWQENRSVAVSNPSVKDTNRPKKIRSSSSPRTQLHTRRHPNLGQAQAHHRRLRGDPQLWQVGQADAHPGDPRYQRWADMIVLPGRHRSEQPGSICALAGFLFMPACLAALSGLPASLHPSRPPTTAANNQPPAQAPSPRVSPLTSCSTRTSAPSPPPTRQPASASPPSRWPREHAYMLLVCRCGRFWGAAASIHRRCQLVDSARLDSGPALFRALCSSPDIQPFPTESTTRSVCLFAPAAQLLRCRMLSPFHSRDAKTATRAEGAVSSTP